VTEQEWLTSDDPAAMLQCLRDLSWCEDGGASYEAISDRKLRLFCAACFVAAFGHTLGESSPWGHWQDGIQGHCDLSPQKEAMSWASNPSHEGKRSEFAALLRDVVGNPCCCVVVDHGQPEHGRAGDPWLTPTALALARAAYEDRPGRKCGRCGGSGKLWKQSKYSQYYYPTGDCPDCHDTGRIDDGSLDPLTLCALADALEEAGCSDEALPSHLRSAGPHVRGCWALDLILGYE
jgi:hypothetical protein